MAVTPFRFEFDEWTTQKQKPYLTTKKSQFKIRCVCETHERAKTWPVIQHI